MLTVVFFNILDLFLGACLGTGMYSKWAPIVSISFSSLEPCYAIYNQRGSWLMLGDAGSSV